MDSKTHIAVVSVPAFSHQASILALCERLLHLHPHLHVTFIVPVLGSLSNASKSLIESLPSSNIHTILLPPVTLQETINPALQIPLAMSRSMPSIRDALNSLSSTKTLVALVADYLAYETLELARGLDILSYIYFPSAAMVLSLCLHSSRLDETVSCEYRELLEPIRIPGCIPIHGRDLPTSLQDRSSDVYKHFLRRSKALHLADGILLNSFKELEGGEITTLQERSRGSGTTQDRSDKYPSVYPIGPLVETVKWGSSNHGNYGSECLRWLDRQEPKSVLYVSFGSGGTLSQRQMNELALGLEMSGQKFLWVVREPKDLPSAIYFTGSEEDPLTFLPNGFLERVKGRGMVVPSWAPQAQILSHKATSGFFTHCGWFSILEAVVHGLPMIAWPLFSEQRMVAAMLSEGLNVALRLKVNENGVVEREEIAMVIKSVMIGDEGRKMSTRMKVLQDAAADALKEDGSSTMTLSQLVIEWK